MFRRLWSGLPKDATFPSKLEELGYFVNDQDEVRLKENPESYFKFFLNHNQRINIRQRFEFNHAVEEIVHERLEREGLKKITLPLGTPTDEPHTPVFVTPNLRSKSRIVMIIGECCQDLGMLAGRVATGPGGINEGSMVSLVREIHKQMSSRMDCSPPGIVIANMGQLYWWPDENRAITVSGSSALPLPSLVHAGVQFNPASNQIPLNMNPPMHLKFLFNEMLIDLANDDARLDIIAIGDSCEIVQNFFDDPVNWAMWGGVVSSMVFLGPVHPTDCLSNKEFLDFLAKRSRGYLLSAEPVDTPLAPPDGNPNLGLPPLGCPCYSSSEQHHVECILIKAKTEILNYLDTTTWNSSFVNGPITIVERPKEECLVPDWDQMPDDAKPKVEKVDPLEMKKQIQQLRKWQQFQETGLAQDTDSEMSESSSSS